MQAAILLGGSSWVAGLWGVPASGPLWGAAAEFLNIRAVGAPVTVLLLVMQVGAGGVRVLSRTHTRASDSATCSDGIVTTDSTAHIHTQRVCCSPLTSWCPLAIFALQGVYRGLGDTRTPLYATVASNLVNVVLGYFLIFSFGLGIRGAALATVCSQVRVRALHCEPCCVPA